MTEPRPLADFISSERSRHASGKPLVHNWQEYVPAGSHWMPGDIGDVACPTCLGIGYVRVDLPVGHPDFAKLFICNCAAERQAVAASNNLQRAAGIASSDLGLHWVAIESDQQLERAVRETKETLARGWGWVYAYGPVGLGKTLLLKTAVAETLRRGRGAVLVMWPDLLDHLRQGYGAGDYDDRLAAWRDTPLLAVDEFGRAKDSEWVREAQVKIFAPRYESALDRRTITLFGSNFAPAAADAWFADRVHDSRFSVVEVFGTSMRPLMGVA